ncbi:MAG: hypothetical protein CMB02_00295 [Euryarchaeota archaeon]|nr:hypothetical protein [Euryarchaeota archaeon]
MRVLFAHGFEGSPHGSKPSYMKEALGWEVTAPKMSELGWSIANQTEVLTRLIDENEFDIVIGSSMGGLAAANASSMRPDEDFVLILMAPAFGLAENWEGMEDTGRNAWKTTGERRYTGFELDIMLPWEFMEAAEKMSWPIPLHPTAIMHGKNDEVVPISFSRKVEKECSNVTLHEFDDTHRLKDSMRFISEISDSLRAGKERKTSDEETESDKVLEDVMDEFDVSEHEGITVSGTGEESFSVEEGDTADSEIEQLEAEMKNLEAKMAQKKEALEISREEARLEKKIREEEERLADKEAEKERAGKEVEEAIKKAEEQVIVAKAEVDEALKKAERERSEAEEARLIADIEEEEAREAKADADAAQRKLDEAMKKAEDMGKNAEKITEDLEKDKREDEILERVGSRVDQIDWSRIGKAGEEVHDDLTMINGIDEFIQRKLNVLGIKTYEQISKMDSEISKTVNDALEFLPERVTEMEWTQQAITMLDLQDVDVRSSVDEDEAVVADLSASKINWSQIGEAGDRKSDRMTEIKGVDADIEKKLKILGIRTFDQISKMDKETAEAVNGALGFAPGRVTKMMWAQQAKSLLEE